MDVTRDNVEVLVEQHNDLWRQLHELVCPWIPRNSGPLAGVRALVSAASALGSLGDERRRVSVELKRLGDLVERHLANVEVGVNQQLQELRVLVLGRRNALDRSRSQLATDAPNSVTARARIDELEVVLSEIDQLIDRSRAGA